MHRRHLPSSLERTGVRPAKDHLSTLLICTGVRCGTHAGIGVSRERSAVTKGPVRPCGAVAEEHLCRDHDGQPHAGRKQGPGDHRRSANWCVCDTDPPVRRHTAGRRDGSPRDEWDRSGRRPEPRGRSRHPRHAGRRTGSASKRRCSAREAAGSRGTGYRCPAGTAAAERGRHGIGRGVSRGIEARRWRAQVRRGSGGVGDAVGAGARSGASGAAWVRCRTVRSWVRARDRRERMVPIETCSASAAS